jgi:hypothetical protein
MNIQYVYDETGGFSVDIARYVIAKIAQKYSNVLLS